MNDEQNTKKLVKAALWYAKNLGPVFSVGKNKAPLTLNGHKDASRNPELVEKMWANFPNANIGLSLAKSNLVVVDIDSKPGLDAYDVYADLQTEFGELPKTAHSLTAGGGFHFLYKTDRNIGRHIGVRPGLDILNDGYVILPPSVGPNGKAYEWEALHRINEVEIAPMPEWILDLVGSDRSETPKAHPSNFWDDMLKNGISEGKRNNSLIKITASLLRHFVDPHLAWQLINTVNDQKCRPPIPPLELKKSFESILKKEALRRQNARF